MENRIKKTIVTHNGIFHADDVFAVATLSLVIDVPVEIIRTRDAEVLEKADFVLDVGGEYDAEKNRFDHHQEGGAGSRENGIPYATFGLVWKKYGEKLCGSKIVAERIDQDMITPLDAYDNGVDIEISKFPNVKTYGIESAIGAFVSTWKETDRDADTVFLELIPFAKALLAREIMRERAKEEAKDYVARAYEQAEDKRFIVLDGPYPAHSINTYPEPLFFVRPRLDDGNWSVGAIRNDSKSFENRKNLPVAWAGKRDKEMAEVSGVSDAVFCHKGLFLAVAQSREGAIALAKKAVEA